MNYNDLNSRLQRLYLSINQKFEDNVLRHVQTTKISNGKNLTLRIGFDAQHDEGETINRINSIIGHLANLKDHLKRKLAGKGDDPEKIEQEINQNLPLQIILDLNNQEKHGYPLNKNKHSGKDPKITNISKGLALRPGVKPTAFNYNPITGAGATNNMAIVITAEVADRQGNLLYDFNDLIDKSLDAWKMIINKFSLSD